MPTVYDQISDNKRNSALLIVFVVTLVLSVTGIYSYFVRGDLVLPVIAAIFTIPSTIIGYYAGDKIALATNHAQNVTAQEEPELYRIVENLAITTGLPMPGLFIIDSPALNAFATGRDPSHASVAVTRGLIRALDRGELEGVIAHELSHVQNYDIRFATIVAVFVGFVVILSDLLIRTTIWGGSHRRERQSGGGNAHAFLAVAGFILLIISPIIAKLIQLAVSRQREFLADSSGVLMTRYPEGLARALEKIGQGPALGTAGHATAHLFIANPFKAKSFVHLFSTHPSIEERINRLRSL